MAFFKKKEKVVEITPQPKIETLSFTVLNAQSVFIRMYKIYLDIV